MNRRLIRAALALACLSGVVTLAGSHLRAQAPQPPTEAAAIKSLTWRSIGPLNMAGRVAAVEGIPGDPTTFYVAPAAGGIIKTTNGGVTFKSIFDSADIASVGAITVAPSDHNVVWVGAGEGDPRNSTSFGNGVWRSDDAGATWRHLGLVDTERIKRIRVHPTDPETAYVCALGHAWGANEERGVFKTTDGGKTWQKILYKNADTGCSDIDMDAGNPRILYAGMYTFRRRPWRFDSGGGETAIYKTVDGGASWKKLTSGLPKGPLDRIGMAISRSNPDVVYLLTESTEPGTLWRSDDKGETWRKMNDDKTLTFRPFYYSDLRVDPKDPNRLYTLGGQLSRSKDGGRTFERIANDIHGDHQAMWIDPEDPRRILSGSDGGYQMSHDGGDTWEQINNFPMAQFYHVAFDMRTPYNLCGGLQDNGNWCGPSRTAIEEGIRKGDWFLVSYGDGFFAIPTPDGRYVYSDSQGGVIYQTEVATGNERAIHPYPKKIGSAGEAIDKDRFRFNWNAAIHISPHDPNTIYFGGNVVFRTTNGGQTWDIISPDLTTNDKSKQISSGGPVTRDNTAAEFHCTILTIAESPVERGVIWVGTDDGNIQVTRDAGKTWTNVVKNIQGLPANAWVPAIDPSNADKGVAYVAIDRHQDDDFGPYIFKTADYGKTWTALKGSLPAKGYVHVVREDRKNKNLLYAGTELGVFASWDGGQKWAAIRNNLPPVAVRDIQQHPRDNDLIIATHSRGLFILDDVTALQRLGDATKTDAFAFESRGGIRYHMWNKDTNLGDQEPKGQNPPYGAFVDYYLAADAKDPVTLTIADRGGKLVREITNAPGKAGVNRAVWDLRLNGPTPTAAERNQTGGFNRFNRPTGPWALPGDYKATIKAGGRELTTTVKVATDPRLQTSAADLQAQHDALVALRDLTSRTNAMIDRADDVIRQLKALQDTLKNGTEKANPATVAAVNRALEQVTAFRWTLTREIPMGYRFPPMLREEIQSIASAVASATARPTDPQMLRLQELTADTTSAEARLKDSVAAGIAEVNRLLSGQPHIR